MKRKVLIVVVILVLVLIVGIIYAVDMNRMRNNKPVLFSTWGYDYAPPVQKYKIKEVVDLSNKYTCAQALEKIYEDSVNEYYFSCIKSYYVTVKYENRGEEKVVSALNKGHITLKDLDNFNISYITKQKEKNGFESFSATILDKTETYMLVEPDECELERRTADKIVVNFSKENLTQELEVDDKVIIYYSSSIAESYPARIKADKIQILD